MNQGANRFRVGDTVRALRIDPHSEHTVFYPEIGTITRYLFESPGWPYGLVAQFKDGSEEAFYFVHVTIVEPRNSFVVNLVSQFTVKGAFTV